MRRQLPLLGRLSLTVLLPVVALYLLVALQRLVPFGVLLRDANATAYDPRFGLPFYRGALSNLGILLWWSAATVYAFTAALLRRRALGTGPGRTFLVYLAGFTGLLALDDLFMLHEEVLPVRLGVPEAAVYALYGAAAAGLLWFVRELLDTDFLVLGLAFVFFACSVLIDAGVLLLFGLSGGASLFAEDLAKMLGIVLWLVFALRTAKAVLARHVGLWFGG